MDNPNLTIKESNITPFVLTYSDDIIDLQTGNDILLAGQVDLRGPTGPIGPQLKGLSVFCSGSPTIDEVIGGGLAPYDLQINVANCIAKAKIAATSEYIISIFNEDTQIGTITFDAGSFNGIVSITLPVILAGNYVTFHAPASFDSTLADIGIILKE